MSRSWFCLEFHVSSRLMSHDCVLTVSLSGVAKCSFCVEALAFLSGPFTRCLLTYCKTVVLVIVVYGYDVF